jgi:hypothetical protein
MLIQGSHYDSYKRMNWEEELNHRIERITRKIEALSRNSKHDRYD